MAFHINRVVISGNLTKDPELRQLPSGNSVCKLRIAVNTRAKDRDSGQWTDKPNYFDVTVWGAQGENVAKFLQRGSGLLVDGRLEWREWDAQDGTKRQAVEIIAENTQFVGGREGGAGGGGGGERPAGEFAPAGNAPMPTSASIADDDDIPF
jgi:single-strand DNA-binding protein